LWLTPESNFLRVDLDPIVGFYQKDTEAQSSDSDSIFSYIRSFRRALLPLIRSIASELILMPDPIQKPRPTAPAPQGGGDGDGPKEPKVEKPNTDDLLKRMRKVDPDQARRYRQRTGE